MILPPVWPQSNGGDLCGLAS